MSCFNAFKRLPVYFLYGIISSAEVTTNVQKMIFAEMSNTSLRATGDNIIIFASNKMKMQSQIQSKRPSSHTSIIIAKYMLLALRFEPSRFFLEGKVRQKNKLGLHVAEWYHGKQFATANSLFIKYWTIYRPFCL